MTTLKTTPEERAALRRAYKVVSFGDSRMLRALDDLDTLARENVRLQSHVPGLTATLDEVQWNFAQEKERADTLAAEVARLRAENAEIKAAERQRLGLCDHCTIDPVSWKHERACPTRANEPPPPPYSAITQFRPPKGKR